MTVWRTPHGRQVQLDYRDGTNDYGVIDSILTHDEYGIPEGLTGVAIDVGAHIGAWTVGVAVDNPDLRVIAVEPVPENFELLARNVAQNGLAGRVTLIEGAVGTTTVKTNHRGAPDGDVHRYVGNQRMPEGVTSDELTVYGFTLRKLAKGRVRLLKIDCEGCEYAAFARSAKFIDEIVGEYHDGAEALDLLLAPTHAVTFNGDDRFGNFRAVRR